MYSITIATQPDIEVIKTLRHGIVAFNENILKDRFKMLAILLEDQHENTVGGILAHEICKSFYIEVLWLQEKIRRQGHGTQLMEAAEEEAHKQKCQSITVDTFSFQSEEFYLKMGFERIGEIPNYICNYSRIYLRKKLG